MVHWSKYKDSLRRNPSELRAAMSEWPWQDVSAANVTPECYPGAFLTREGLNFSVKLKNHLHLSVLVRVTSLLWKNQKKTEEDMRSCSDSKSQNSVPDMPT